MDSQKTHQDVLNDLRTFIEFSLLKDQKSWSEWIAATTKNLSNNCWEKKNCNEVSCPAYNNKCGRCWLIAGNLCGDSVQGKFAAGHASCYDCEVFKDVVYKDPVSELQEHILILIHSLRTKQQELQHALDEVKILSGLLPICMGCKKIRDDKGYWTQLESYITKHSEAIFSHGICPDCLKELRPHLAEL